MATTPMFHTRIFPLPPLCSRTLQPNSPFSVFLTSNQRLLSNGTRPLGQTWRHSMSVNAKPVLKDGTLCVNGKDALKGVPKNVVSTPLTGSSAFIGATCADASSRLVLKLGVIQALVRVLADKFLRYWDMAPLKCGMHFRE